MPPMTRPATSPPICMKLSMKGVRPMQTLISVESRSEQAWPLPPSACRADWYPFRGGVIGCGKSSAGQSRRVRKQSTRVGYSERDPALHPLSFNLWWHDAVARHHVGLRPRTRLQPQQVVDAGAATQWPCRPFISLRTRTDCRSRGLRAGRTGRGSGVRSKPQLQGGTTRPACPPVHSLLLN